MIKRNVLIILVMSLFAAAGFGQSTEITYQGQLQFASAPANGNFDFEFLLFDSLGGVSQIGPTITRNGVAVANGIFSVNLDFGANFPGANRFLEIHVKSGAGAYTTLLPRQSITSTPYSVKSLSADNAANAANATNSVNAINAVTATNFTGNLNGDVTGTQGSTTVARLQGRNVANTVPLNDQVLKFNSAANQWLPGTDNTGSGGGTITAVNPGTGLTGGGITGDVTLGIATGGVGTTQLADSGVTDAKINSVSGNKVTGTVANATNAGNATNAATATNALSLGGVAANQYLQTSGNGSGLTNLNAGSIATGTLSNSRLGLIPTANIADSAVTAPKIASGQVVKSFNTLKDDVTLAAGSNITITPAGNTLTIASTSGGVGGGGTTGSVPLWSAGATLGNSAITQNVNGVQLPNGVQLASGAQGNNISFGSPSGETGMTIAGASARADIRFDGTLKLLNGPAGSPPPATNGIAINTAGNVGIGTAAPSLINGGSGRFASISDSTNPGLALTNTSARQFFMYSAGGSGSFRVFDATSNADRLTLDSTGNFGIGTTTPAHRLSLIGGPLWTSNQFTGALELGNASAIGWRANAAGNRFGIGQSTGGLYFFNTLSDPGTTGSPANFVMQITDTGNVIQPINSNGLVKAMAVVENVGNGTVRIVRCFNGITNLSSGGCGFTITSPLAGVARIDFGFPVSNRFVLVTPEFDSLFGDSNAGANYRPFNSTSIEVFTFFSGNSNGLRYANFTLILY